MSGILTRFRIAGLHNVRTIDVPITDNKLVLVGENGAGKSTVANFIYFFLSRQWNRILEYEFHSISATLDSKQIFLNRDDIDSRGDSFSTREDFERYRNRLRARWSPRIDYDLDVFFSSHPIDYLARISRSRAELTRVSNELNIPPSIVTEYIRQFINEQLPLSDKMKEVDHILNEAIDYQVLYLPTYRRIEQDLKSIFPGVEFDFRRVQERLARRSNVYIELVEFGMDDVERTINRKMNDIKDSVRNDLNKLTGTYLRDVIQGAYRSFNLLPRLRELDEQNIDAIFSRIPTAILSDQEQKRLRDIITDIKRTDIISDDDKVVAHFLTQLIDLHTIQQENERDIREFVRVCNNYLSGKEMAYNNSNFEISINQFNDKKSSQKITMRMLSSGEKQIVSLFSHIYLSGGTGYFVVIDEPELSLSVPWQKRLLPDILETERCEGLLAVTHSPFIFENQMDKYAHSLEEFVEPANVLSR